MCSDISNITIEATLASKLVWPAQLEARIRWASVTDISSLNIFLSVLNDFEAQQLFLTVITF